MIALVGMFRATAEVVAQNCAGPEGTTSVRKLIEAKDCACRDYIEGKEPQ